MIIKESFKTREDGVKLIRVYSDKEVMMRQVETGILYDEAIDPADLVREYEETDIPIGYDEEIIEPEMI